MDVHKKQSQICILTEAGELTERRVCSEPERFAARHEVIVADSNFAPTACTLTPGAGMD